MPTSIVLGIINRALRRSFKYRTPFNLDLVVATTQYIVGECGFRFRYYLLFNGFEWLGHIVRYIYLLSTLDPRPTLYSVVTAKRTATYISAFA
jgi:hypothetical protein